jgi:hypothetical protein
MGWRDIQKEVSKYSQLSGFEYLLELEYTAVNSFLSESEGTINRKEQEIIGKMKAWEIKSKSGSATHLGLMFHEIAVTNY